MRVIAFNGSPHKTGNTNSILCRCLTVLEKEGISTELIHIGNTLEPCRGCELCRKSGKERCIIDDPLNQWFDKIIQADGLLLGSPVYFYGMHPSMKGFIDRVGYLARARLRAGESYTVLAHKIGAAIAVDGFYGAPQTIQAMQSLFMVTQMIVPGAMYWPVAKGMTAGDVINDTVGMQYLADLAKQMAWLIKAIHK